MFSSSCLRYLYWIFESYYAVYCIKTWFYSRDCDHNYKYFSYMFIYVTADFWFFCR